MTGLNAQGSIVTGSPHGKGKLSPGKIMNRNILTCRVVGAIFMVSAIQAQEPVGSSEMMTRQERGEKVMNSLSGGKGLPPHFEQLQKDFPELAHLTLKYALGDIWGRQVLNPKTRQLVSLAGFAAQGTMPQFKLHAQYALNYGVTPEELMEVIYITTVTSGYPRALIAAGTLKELFQENNVKFPVTSHK
jgi:4-carboxymuconolactone decarboxylase